MPETDDGIIDELEDRLKSVKPVTTMLEQGMTPENILEEVLGGFGVNIMDRMPTGFSCNCSRERVEKALISVGRSELESMIRDGEPIEMNCHFCNTSYRYDIDELKSILDSCE